MLKTWTPYARGNGLKRLPLLYLFLSLCEREESDMFNISCPNSTRLCDVISFIEVLMCLSTFAESPRGGKLGNSSLATSIVG